MSFARYQLFSGGYRIGAWNASMGTLPTFLTFTLNQTTDQLEFVLQVEEDVTINQLGLLLASITGAAPTLRVSIQGVDGSGNPDGVIKGGGSPASVNFNPSGLGWSAASWHWLALDNTYIAARGEFIAIVVDYVSGTIDGSNSVTFSVSIGNGANCRIPYQIDNNAGSRTKNQFPPVVGYGSTVRKYGSPIQSISDVPYNLTSTPADEYGIKFTLPVEWGETYKIAGVRFRSSSGIGTASSTKMILYGGTTTAVANSTGAATEATVHQDITIDSDIPFGSFSGGTTILFDESTLVTLHFGATYRIAFQPQDAGKDWIITKTVFAADTDREAHPGGTLDCLTKRLDSGNWTDVTTEKVMMELILADITDSGSTPMPALLVQPRRPNLLLKL
jgi:hypothetical protein